MVPNRTSDEFSRKSSGKDLLTYKDTHMTNENGIKCRIIDVENTDFSKAQRGRKATLTMVIEAQGGEHTAQIFANAKETQWPYTAQKGDAIFVQGDIPACLKYIETGVVEEKHGPIDVYVPDNAKLSKTGRVQFKDLYEEGHELQPIDTNKSGTFVKSRNTDAKILHEANKVWACIAYPDDQVKFFPPNSSFKLLDGKVSGINQEAFDTTWELLPTSQPTVNHHTNDM